MYDFCFLSFWEYQIETKRRNKNFNSPLFLLVFFIKYFFPLQFFDIWKIFFFYFRLSDFILQLTKRMIYLVIFFSSISGELYFHLFLFPFCCWIENLSSASKRHLRVLNINSSKLIKNLILLCRIKSTYYTKKWKRSWQKFNWIRMEFVKSFR